jgi:asparagine synthase (glutamine-hydrolysing)
VALLVKQDKMSMAASIESRVPYLDHHLVEYAFALPDYWKVRGASGKYLLRQAARGLVPEAIINRPKRGFPLPLVQWLREPGNPLTGILLEGTTLREGLLDARYVRSRLARFQAGENNTLELWGMLNLELWRRNFLASTRVGGEAMAA